MPLVPLSGAVGTGRVESWRTLVGPTLAAIVAAAILLGIIVGSSPSAWMLLGAGRGAIAEPYYPVWAFVLIFATALGQAAGWAGGSGIAYYAMIRLGLPAGAFASKLAMSAVYVGLGALPLLVYHLTFGRPLLGMPREGLAAGLTSDYPDAYRLLFTLHPVIDLSVIPFTALFFWALWFLAPERSPLGRYGVALFLVCTSLAVSLSLAIHATLVHLRF